MLYKNFLRLLFLFFLNLKFSILSTVSWKSLELANYIKNNPYSYIYSFESLNEDDELEFQERIYDIIEYYYLYTYIYYIESIDENLYSFKNSLSNYLQNYFGYDVIYYAFIIMIKDKSQVIILMGNEYSNKFTINKSNDISDLANYIVKELSNDENTIEEIFYYSIEQLENALEGKEIEPGKSYKAVIITIVIIVIIAIVIIAIYNICCKRNKIVSIGYKTYDPLK